MVKFSAFKVKTVVIFCVIVLFAISYIALGCLWHQNHKLAQEVINSRKVYVYDLQKVLLSTNLIEAKRQYEQEILNLNDELLKAEQKIKSLKDAKVKEDFSTVYLNNLRLKRDEITKNYETQVNTITQNINAALSEIAKQQHIAAIFVRDAVAVNTPDVVDITQDVVQKISQ